MIKKIFTVVVHHSYDYETGMGCSSFGTLKEAQSAMKSAVSDWDKENPDGFNENTIRNCGSMSIKIYEDGDYTRNHIEWEIFEDEVEFD